MNEAAQQKDSRMMRVSSAVQFQVTIFFYRNRLGRPNRQQKGIVFFFNQVQVCS